MRKGNQVVRTYGHYGTWGRGHCLYEAMENAEITKDTRFTFYIFNNDEWDIEWTGQVTWPVGCLVSKVEMRANSRTSAWPIKEEL